MPKWLVVGQSEILAGVEHEAFDQNAPDNDDRSDSPAATARMVGVFSLERTGGALVISPASGTEILR